MSEETAIATPLTRQSWILHIFAALAEKERSDIGAGAKAALAAARARGVNLGNPGPFPTKDFALVGPSSKFLPAPLVRIDCESPRMRQRRWGRESSPGRGQDDFANRRVPYFSKPHSA